ncbi:MAG: C4-type zinc ribbon domain-containing protein [Armatimonadetes bacterium]|nr:C4-type zinc ribbon domain-containing protein [Armatimonadota bacterium]
MRDDLAILHEVQQADTELARLRDALAGLDTGDELAAQIQEAQRELEGVLEQHRATEKEATDRDLELKTLEEKKSKFERDLYSGTVHNPRQLSDLQSEVAMLAREIGKAEDRILELMESLEAERSDIREREVQMKDLEARLGAARAQYEATGGRLQHDIAELEATRQEKASHVRAQLLKRYEQIRIRQGNLGLVKLTETTCPGCRITLPSETVKGLKAGRQDLTCENCGRMLFWAREED